ncbi:MAG: SpoIIE family protein phosphatase [Lachnospiraceae bacterium]|nr:SpoIIE family protein phosphatase [Lachnospiraceae bacterium]
MKVIQKKMLLQIVLGFFLGRVNLFGINPIGIAFFAAGYTEEGAKIPVGISVVLGMLMVFPMENVLCSGMAMLAVVLAVDLLEKKNVSVRMGHAALLLCFAVGALTAFRLYLMPHSRYDIWMGFLETVLALAATRILYDGIHFLLHSKKGQNLGNEEVISLVMLGAFGVLGLPDIIIAEISVILTVTYFLTLIMGYCYGTGTGAIAGAIGGCVLAVCGWESSMIGIMALMGICAGMLREQGKLLLCASFFLMAFALGSVVNQSMIGMGELEGIAIAGGVFLLIPEKFLGKIQVHAGSWQDNWESEKLQKLMKYKLKDFSNSFQNLSSSMAKESQEGELMNPKDARKMMEIMSNNICSRCENCENCRGQIALMRPEMFGTLALAQEQGQIVLEQMPVEFTRECIHQERFLSEANQNIHIANMAMGFQNKMAQNQRVIARQMREVGEIVDELAEKLPNVQKLPADLQERIIKELRKRRVTVSEIAFYEKYDGRLEVHVKGRTWRGRYVTTKEVGEMISDLIGCKVIPCEECRKVFPREEEEFIFEECAKLTAITGISRLPKAGEEVSGDTFSCMYLPSGELLMALSDGMGSGDDACEESEQVIELLEQMTEAGFSESSSLRLINSIYMSKEDSHNFATADIAVLNLYKRSCQFVKCGASTTYLYHQGEVERIEGEALPIGVMDEMEPYMRNTGIAAGDYVIMMTDGVADSFLEEQECLEILLWECFEDRLNPQDIADRLLDEAMARWNMEPEDDMSVMVVKVYDNLDRKIRDCQLN